jgi:ligand-binding sensor domain-containing protein/two-component sensor histidine kinase
MILITMKRIRTSKVLTLLVLSAGLGFLGSEISFALDGRKLISQYAAHDWSTEHGLPDNYIQAIFQSKEGYLWLGTQRSGAVRFDGVRFATWPSESSFRGKEISIRAFSETKDGGLWLGTEGAGLWQFNEKKLVCYGEKDGLPNDFVRALYEDRNGVLWIGLGGKALAQWNQGHLTSVPIPEDGPAGVVDFWEDKRGGLWLTGAGLWRFQDGQFTNIRKQLGLRPQSFTSVCEGPDGSIWVATLQGLLRLRGNQVETYLEADGVSDDQVRSLCFDREGNLWIGTNSGLDRFRDGKFTRCLTEERAPYDLVYSIFEDREGSLWIGTNGGLTRLRDDKFSNLTTKDGLLQNLIASAIEARDGSVWVATQTRGVARLKDGETTIYDKQVGLPRDSMKCIHEDRQGVVWAGTQHGGLTRIAEGIVTTIGEQGKLEGRVVAAIQDDTEGHLWVLAEDGALFRFKDGEFDRADAGEGFFGTKTEAIHLGMDGSFWAVTDAGLFSRKQSRWQNYGLPKSPIHLPVQSLYADKDGDIWLCLTSGGLVRFREGRFTSYGTRHGLFDDSPYAVLEDNKNRLWMSCRDGIFRISKEDLARLDRGEIEQLTCVNFGEVDGMSSRRCSKVGFPLATKLSDGRLCFPTDKGIAIVDPESLPHNPIVPPVVIESVVLDHRRFEPDQITAFPAGTKDVEIHYSGISLRAPERLQFKYRLDGYDKEWVEAKNCRVAHYQNIRPGDYRFQVIAANEDGIWNQEKAVLGFSVEPFFYQTGWFYGSCGLLIGIGAGLIHWWRIDRAKRRFAAVLDERTRIARDLHDTLEQGLVGISMQLNLAGAKFLSTPNSAHKHLEKARYMLRLSMADARSAILNLRNAVARPKDLLSELARIAEELGAGNSIKLQTQASGTPADLSPFTEDTLIRIGQEAMTNVIKHARARTIRIDLAFEPHELSLRIEDDGCGFDPASIGGGEGRYGLLGMRERTEKLGGELTVWSATGQGTIVRVVLPKGKVVTKK